MTRGVAPRSLINRDQNSRPRPQFERACSSWHGFRALASTQLNELGWNDKWIEAQLSHSDRNKVRKAYNHAKYLPQRRVMMQAWADYIDMLRASTDASQIAQAGENALRNALTVCQVPALRETMLPGAHSAAAKEVADPSIAI